MGSWDCYCSICGGPLKAQSVRSTSRVVIRKSALHDGADGEGVDEDGDEEREGEDGEPPHESARESEDHGDDGVSDAGSMDGDDEEREDEDEDDDGYNPRIVQSTDLYWTGDCRFLGFNAEASGVSKYVSATPAFPSVIYGKIAMY